jgi:hypothetical protein
VPVLITDRLDVNEALVFLSSFPTVSLAVTQVTPVASNNNNYE